MLAVSRDIRGQAAILELQALGAEALDLMGGAKLRILVPNGAYPSPTNLGSGNPGTDGNKGTATVALVPSVDNLFGQ
jgi:hypothetical protein